MEMLYNKNENELMEHHGSATDNFVLDSQAEYEK